MGEKGMRGRAGTGRLRGVWGAAGGWGVWGAGLVLAPCVSGPPIVRAIQAGVPDDLLWAPSPLYFLGLGSLPVCVLAFGVAYALRGRLRPHLRTLVMTAAILSVAYLALLAWEVLEVTDGRTMGSSLLWRAEWPLRHLSLCAWAVLGATALPWATAAAPSCGRGVGAGASAGAGADAGTGGDAGEAAAGDDALERLPEFGGLSPREREVLAALLSGEGVADIARRCSLSASSVSTYRARALEKLGVGSLDELGASLGHGRNGAGGRACDVGATGLRASTQISLGIGTPGWASVLALALSGGYLVRVCLFALGDLAMGLGAWSERAPSLGSFVGQGLSDAAVPLVWLVAWVLLAWVFVRARHLTLLRVRPSGDLAVLAVAVLVQGLALGGAHATVSSSFVPMAGFPYEVGAVSVARAFFWLSVVGWPVGVAGLVRASSWQPGARGAASGEVGERRLLYLRGRGLGELQARVVCRIAEGAPAASIVGELHVAPGTVSGYRAQAYALLGVHSQRELAELLEREVG